MVNSLVRLEFCNSFTADIAVIPLQVAIRIILLQRQTFVVKKRFLAAVNVSLMLHIKCLGPTLELMNPRSIAHLLTTSYLLPNRFAVTLMRQIAWRNEQENTLQGRSFIAIPGNPVPVGVFSSSSFSCLCFFLLPVRRR